MTPSPSPPSRFFQVWHQLWRALRGPGPRRTLRQELRRFFGRDLRTLETHDKHFPGYDVASVARALASFHEDCCTEFRLVGSCPAPNMRALLDWFKNPFTRNTRPDPPTYQRVAT